MWVDVLGLSTEVKKEKLCRIMLLVGHSSTANYTGEQKDQIDAKDVIESPTIVIEDHKKDGERIPKIHKVSCVTCFRVGTNDSVKKSHPDHYIPNPDRGNELIYPYPQSKGADEIKKDPKNKTSVEEAFKNELRAALAESTKMCSCCEEIRIYSRGLDMAGQEWLSWKRTAMVVDGKEYKLTRAGTRHLRDIYHVNTHICPK
jgi:hypothetical protein